MSKRRINKVAVVGSGIMGSAIACHFANIGVEVLLLDIIPRELTEKEIAKGLTLQDALVRNRIVNQALANAIKSKPAPLYNGAFAKRITTGNLEDDIAKVASVDWIIEVVIERLDIKQQVFENLEKHRTPGTLITSNTSGIPIGFMSEGRSEDFQAHFCGTHFFNPPRYLKLFEIIPGPKTKPEVLAFFNTYAEQFLGKTTVIAKDTPAFIGNRIGIFSIMSLFHTVKQMGLTIEEVDKLSGPVIGRPKSATFRTVDLVGLDTLVHVANGIRENCPNDERLELFELPDFITKMMDNKWLGSKTGQGFYKKTKDSNGKTEILSLDLNTLEYRAAKKGKFATLELTKSIENVADRFKVLVNGKDKAGTFYRKTLAALFGYVTHRIPEIADEFYKIDDAMKAGFGWGHGPFQIWDAIGLQAGIEIMKAEGHQPASWIEDMQKAGCSSFYSVKQGATYYYDIASKKQIKVPGQDAFIILDNIRESSKVFKNSGVVIEDLGDGILNCEFRSKMNSIGGDVLAGIHKAIDLAEKDFDGLVIGNQGANFSVGANIGMIFMMAVEQEYDELNAAIKYFQDTVMRLRYSSIPTIMAPHGLTLGGGCELTLHADRVVAAAESYIGLVEFGVGVIPGGGGSKEMALRASDIFQKGDVELNVLQEHFLTIGMAKVSTSAHEAYDLDILKPGKDIVVVNTSRQIATAKALARQMADMGYTKPAVRNDVKVLGKQALGMFLVGTDSMNASKYISEHDQKIANKLAYVMAGGDLSEPTLVSEQYLLDLEREAFLSLTGERKTLERLQHMIQKENHLETNICNTQIKMKTAYIVKAYRTAVGKAPKGVFRFKRTDELAAETIKFMMDKLPSLDPKRIDDVIVGNAMPEGAQGLNMARLISLMGLDIVDVPGVTVNRFCSSGIETIAMAVAKIQSGMADCIIAGGAESMSSVPMTGFKPELNYDVIQSGHEDYYWGMGNTAEAVAKQFNVSREDQDTFAYNSHMKALKAQAENRFQDQIVPITVDQTFINEGGKKQTKSYVVQKDEGPRQGTSKQALAKLRAVFAQDGSVTAGNSSQMSDGAAFVMVMSEEMVKELNLEPIARMANYAAAGVEPRIMGIGPVKAIPKALKQAGLKQEDIKLIELNEAFASQSLAVIRELDLNPDIINVNGGAIALGHPLGCTGAKLSVQLFDEMRKRDMRGQYGMITMCVGTGQGAAGIFEFLK